MTMGRMVVGARCWFGHWTRFLMGAISSGVADGGVRCNRRPGNREAMRPWHMRCWLQALRENPQRLSLFHGTAMVVAISRQKQNLESED